MSNFLISLLVAISAGTWVFSKMVKQSGGDRKTSVIVGAIAGILVLIVVKVTIDNFFTK